MNCMDPLPNLRLAEDAAGAHLQFPVCNQDFKAIEGFAFQTFWHAEDQHGERERKAGYPTFDKLTCILCFVNDEESGHC